MARILEYSYHIYVNVCIQIYIDWLVKDINVFARRGVRLEVCIMLNINNIHIYLYIVLYSIYERII